MNTADPLALLRGRRSRARLASPAPSREEVSALLRAACAAPDHGRLRPWRFLVLEGAALTQLGEAYAAAHADRDPSATDAEIARSRAKPLRAPMIVVVVRRPRPHPKIAAWEQRAATSAATYGLLLAAHATGWGAMWRSGWFGEAPKVRAHLGLADDDEVHGWVYLGTPAGPAPVTRVDDEPDVIWLG